jgi:hypothetical protein
VPKIEFDGLRANGEILDGRRVVATVDRVAGALTVRTGGDLVGWYNGEANGIARCIPTFVNHAERGKVQRLGPECQAVLLAHLLLLPSV